MDGKESFGIIASGTVFVINLYMFTRMCLQSFYLRGATTVLNAHSEIHRNKVLTLELWVFGKGIEVEMGAHVTWDVSLGIFFTDSIPWDSSP